MSLMNVGVSALTANQAALQTIGHNIANVNTKGYSRQTVALETVAGQNRGNGFIGNGVSVASVMRNYSELLNKQSNAANAASAADAARSQSLTQMQDVFSGGDSSLGSAVSNMMNAFSDLQTSPTDASARNVVLARMSELASRFRASSAALEEQDYTTKLQITNDVNQVNSLAVQVATFNTQISRALASGHSPNDLLDQRDQVIREINQYVKTTQVEADDGSINLFVGGSQPLVLGASSGQLSVSEATNYPGSGKLALYFSQPGGEKVELTANMVAGGEVAGLLKFNNEDLAEARNLMGRMALAIGTELNKQNKLGLTLSGEHGSDLFYLPTSMPGYSNIPGYDLGTPSASVAFTDTHALVASDYKIVFGANHPADTKIVRLSDGKTRSLGDPALNYTTTGTNSTFTVDGLTFTLDATANAGADGQSILFKPFSSAASDIKALVYTPADLAVANPVSAAINQDNKGTLQLSQLKAVGTGVPAVGTPVTLTFSIDATGKILYDYNGNTSGPQPYQSGKPITIDGWQITLAGTPQAGDKVEVSNALEPSLGDSYKRNAGNATAFLDLRDAKIFDGGTALTDGFSSAMAVVGTRTQSAQYAAELSASVAASLEGDRTAVSGVNLDEEAARLMQFQQAYQASAKVIQTAQSLFDSVLNAVNR
ncbi:flagellar hook-associated protein FlgK [Comamonas sp. GB3 AK4-5]|uniref:flagellar hook-associated protein FlgK n=1 Tax=Comamonas sp. GB3 AK4-5 TaxID=3231487 RepID=UPI00351EA6BB